MDYLFTAQTICTEWEQTSFFSMPNTNKLLTACLASLTERSTTGAKIIGKQLKCLYGILSDKEKKINEFLFLASNCVIVHQPPVSFISGHK